MVVHLTEAIQMWFDEIISSNALIAIALSTFNYFLFFSLFDCKPKALSARLK